MPRLVWTAILAVGLAVSAAQMTAAGEPAAYAYPPPPYPFPYPRPSVHSSPHLKRAYYYTHHRQTYPGRWIWLMPQYHELLRNHRGYYGNYIQHQFLRDY